jgi:hypothetical protein
MSSKLHDPECSVIKERESPRLNPMVMILTHQILIEVMVIRLVRCEETISQNFYKEINLSILALILCIYLTDLYRYPEE